jgi:hypothetical protein
MFYHLKNLYKGVLILVAIKIRQFSLISSLLCCLLSSPIALAFGENDDDSFSASYSHLSEALTYKTGDLVTVKEHDRIATGTHFNDDIQNEIKAGKIYIGGEIFVEHHKQLFNPYNIYKYFETLEWRRHTTFKKGDRVFDSSGKLGTISAIYVSVTKYDRRTKRIVVTLDVPYKNSPVSYSSPEHIRFYQE